MRKKLISILLAAVMICSLLPTMAFAAPTEYDVWVGTTQVTSDNAGDVLGDGTVSYTPASGTDAQKLTLNNANITTSSTYDSGVSGFSAAICAGSALDMVITGANTVTDSNPGEAANNYGIYVAGALTVSGTGALNATAVSATAIFYSMGIRCKDAELVLNGGTVTATGDTAGLNSATVNGGTLIATCSNHAVMEVAPTVPSTGYAVTAAFAADGSQPAIYVSGDIATYRYVKVAPFSAYNI